MRGRWNGGQRVGLILALAAAAHSAYAGTIGNLRSVAPASGDATAAWELATDSGGRVRVELLRADLLHVQASRGDKLMPAGDKATAIVLPQAAAKIAARIEEDADEVRIRTDALVLHVQRRPLRLALDRIEAGKTVLLWRELQPLDLDKAQSVQVLSSTADERFYGGGQQNGRFEFKGRELEISYSGGWEEGDRPSPAPMLLSSHGWGMLRNTWSDGNYDLRQSDQ